MRAFSVALGALTAAALLAAACGGGGGDTPSDTGQPTMSAQAKLVVNSNTDKAERDGVLTLREALLLASGGLAATELDADEARQVQGQPGAGSPDDIVFAQPFQGAEAIVLTSALPPLSGGGDVIDGSADGGVTVDGKVRAFTCLEVASSGNALRGLQITGCRTGILVDQDAGQNRIGGSATGQRNVISGNVVGIELRGTKNVIQGNFIGVDPSGTKAMANEFEGIWATPVARENIIGGGGPGEGNVLSGNDLFAISLDGAVGNVVQGNLIGLNAAGSQAVENKYGMTVQNGATGNVIGGEKPEERNVISGNNTGLLVRDAATSGNTVRGNYFGTDIAGKSVVPNAMDIWKVEGAGENQLAENRMGLGR